MNRIKWVDIARGWGIVMIIIGHTGMPALTTLLYTFSVPLFFFISGFCFKTTYGMKEFLKRKIKTLIIPYFCLGGVIVIYEYFVSKSFNLWNLIIQVRYSSVWFLTCLFLTEIIFYILVKGLKQNDRRIGIISFMLMILGFLYYRFINIPLIWNIDICMISLFYFYIGYRYKKSENVFDKIINTKNKKILTFLIFAFLNIICGYSSYKLSGEHMDMYFNRYGIEILNFIATIAGISCTIIVSKALNISFIEYIGKNSLIYYAWNLSIVISGINNIVNNFIIYNNLNKLFQILYCSILTVITIIILTIITKLVMRTKLKIILGK